MLMIATWKSQLETWPATPLIYYWISVWLTSANYIPKVIITLILKNTAGNLDYKLQVVAKWQMNHFWRNKTGLQCRDILICYSLTPARVEARLGHPSQLGDLESCLSGSSRSDLVYKISASDPDSALDHVKWSRVLIMIPGADKLAVKFDSDDGSISNKQSHLSYMAI